MQITQIQSAPIRLAAFLLLLVSTLAVPAFLSAAEFHLVDGTTVEGVVIETTESTIEIFDTEGTFRKISLDSILGADLEKEVDPALVKKSKRALAKRAESHEEGALDLLKKLRSAEKAATKSVTRELDRIEDATILPALKAGLRAKSARVREYSVDRASRMKSDRMVIPLVVASMFSPDAAYTKQTRELALEQNPTLTRRTYETIAARPSAKPEYRVKALQELALVGNRENVPGLIITATRVTHDIRLTLVRSKGIKEIPVSLGSLQQAASQVDIETPEAEVIQVHTSAVVPVEIQQQIADQTFSTLATLTGQNHGDDVEAWVTWWKEDEARLKAAAKAAEAEQVPPTSPTGNPGPARD